MCVPEFCFRGSFPYYLLFEIGHREITRLTNAFSKKIENHCHAIALHFVYYNFVKLHKTLRVTPAMAAGLTKRFMSIEDIVNLVPEPEAKKRGSYKRKEPLNKRFFLYLLNSKRGNMSAQKVNDKFIELMTKKNPSLYKKVWDGGFMVVGTDTGEIKIIFSGNNLSNEEINEIMPIFYKAIDSQKKSNSFL